MKNCFKFLIMLISIILFISVILRIFSPIPFVKDGLVTKTEVNSFNNQYVYESEQINRHKAESIKNMYLFNFGFDKIDVQSVKYGDKPNVNRIVPFIYKWEINKEDCAYKVIIGETKYYFSYYLN